MAQTFGPRVLPQITPMQNINDTPLIPVPFDQLMKVEEMLFNRDMMRERMDMEREKFQMDKELMNMKMAQSIWETLGKGIGGSSSRSKSSGTSGGGIGTYVPWLREQSERQSLLTQDAYKKASRLMETGDFRGVSELLMDFQGQMNDPNIVKAQAYSEFFNNRFTELNKDGTNTRYFEQVIAPLLLQADTEEKVAEIQALMSSDLAKAQDYRTIVDGMYDDLNAQLVREDSELLREALGFGGIYKGLTGPMIDRAADYITSAYVQTDEGAHHLATELAIVRNSGAYDNELELARQSGIQDGLNEDAIQLRVDKETRRLAEQNVKRYVTDMGMAREGITGLEKLDDDILAGYLDGFDSSTSKDKKKEKSDFGNTMTVNTDDIYYQDEDNPAYLNEKTWETSVEEKSRKLDEVNNEIETIKKQLEGLPEGPRRAQLQRNLEDLVDYELVLQDAFNAEWQIYKQAAWEYDKNHPDAQEKVYKLQSVDQNNEIQQALDERMGEYMFTPANTKSAFVGMGGVGGPPVAGQPTVNETKRDKIVQEVSNGMFKTHAEWVDAKEAAKTRSEAIQTNINESMANYKRVNLIAVLPKDPNKAANAFVNTVATVYGNNQRMNDLIAERQGMFYDEDQDEWIEVSAEQRIPAGAAFLPSGSQITGVEVSEELDMANGKVGQRIYVSYTAQIPNPDKEGEFIEKPMRVSFIDDQNKFLRQLVTDNPEMEGLTKAVGRQNMNLTFSIFKKFNQNVDIPEITYASPTGMKAHVSRHAGEYYVSYEAPEGQTPIPGTMVHGSIEEVKNIIADAEQTYLTAGPSNDSTQQTNPNIITNVEGTTVNDDGEVLNKLNARISDLSAEALSLLEDLSVFDEDIWHQITSTSRIPGEVDTVTGQPYEEMDYYNPNSTHTRHGKYSPAFDLRIDEKNPLGILGSFYGRQKLQEKDFIVLVEGGDADSKIVKLNKELNEIGGEWVQHKGKTTSYLTINGVPFYNIIRLPKGEAHFHLEPRKYYNGSE